MRRPLWCSLACLFLMLVTAASAAAESPEVQWTQAVGGTGSDMGYAVGLAHYGGYVVAGKTASPGAAYVDILFAKLDGSGDVAWQTNIGGAAEDVCNSVARTSDGGYVLAGYTGVQPSYIDYYLVKTNAAGEVQWSRTYGATDVVEECASVIETSDGGLALVGDAGYQIYLVKTDSEGMLEWEQTYHGGSGSDHCYSLTQCSDGGFALVGWRSTGSLTPTHDMMVIKVGPEGAFQWRRLFDSGVEDRGHRIIQLADGDYVVGGSTGNFSLWKLAPNGSLRWQHTYGTPTNDVCLGFDAASDGGYLLGGYTYDYDLGYEFYAVRTDADGDLLWEETYGGALWDYSWDLTATDDEGWLLVGTTQSYGSGGNDLYALKLGPDASGTGVDEASVAAPRVQLSRPTPNPFTAGTKLGFSLEIPASVELSVYDVAGRRVRRLWSGAADAGPHDVMFDGSGDDGTELGAGVYFCRLTAHGETLTRKLLLLR